MSSLFASLNVDKEVCCGAFIQKQNFIHNYMINVIMGLNCLNES